MSLYDSPTYLEDLDTAMEASVGLKRLKGAAVLVAGATGTIGSFLVDVLLRFNHERQGDVKIYAMGRQRERLAERFDPSGGENLFYVERDIRSPLSLDFSADYIIHAAGNAYPAKFNSDPVGTIMGNMDGTHALLEYGRACGARRLLYVSTGEVYGQGGADEYDETYSGYVDPTSPRSCYPSSKRAAETLCAAYCRQFGLETVIVRPCHTYGPWMTAGDDRANAQFLRSALQGEDIVLNSPGAQVRSYCYAADCASAILTVLLNGKAGEAYNSANPEAVTTVAGFARTVAERAGRRVIFKALPPAGTMQTPISRQVLSAAKLEALGWRGNYPLEKGVAHTLAILGESSVAKNFFKI